MVPFGFNLVFERDSDIWLLIPKERFHPQLLIKSGRSPAVSSNGRMLAFVRDHAIWIADITSPQVARPVCCLPESTVYDPNPIHAPVLSWRPHHPELVFSVFCSYRLEPISIRKPSEVLIGDETVTLGSIYQITVGSSLLGKGKLKDALPWLTPASRTLGEKGLLSASHPSWSPDGQKLAIARGGCLSLVTIKTSREQFGRYEYDWNEKMAEGIRIDGGAGDSTIMGCNSISWRPDGRAIVTSIRRWNGSAESWVELYIVKSGIPIRKENILRRTFLPDHSRFTPDGRSLIFVQQISHDSCVFWQDLTTGREQLLIRSARNPQCFKQS